MTKKQKRFAICAPFIGGIIIAIIKLVPYFFRNNQPETVEQVQQKQEVKVDAKDSAIVQLDNRTINQTNDVRGDQYNTFNFRDTSKYNNRGKSQPPPTTINNSDNRVYNNNEYKITISEEEVDTDTNLPDNYEITDTTLHSELAYRINPKVGMWEEPFMAVLLEESERVKASLTTRSSILMGFKTGTMPITLRDGRKVDVYFNSANGQPASRKFLYYVKFTEKPSVVFFGDLVNNKVFVKAF